MANRLLLLALFLSIACPAAWAQGPAGAEFRVNSYTTSYQSYAAVTSDANGNFVVVWHSCCQDGSGAGVFGQRFSASGVPQESEFRVNAYTTGSQRDPAVASDANGNFVVVWPSYGLNGFSYRIFGQRFNAAGLSLGSEFQVNSDTTRIKRLPEVASDANGNFVVVWQSAYQDGSSFGVFGQRFNASGVPQASEFRANTYTFSAQGNPAVASDANGNFVVVWPSYIQDGWSYGIFGQRFDAAGLPLGSEFRVNSYTTSSQNFPAVASDANGNFVVVWQGRDGSYSYGIFGQRFNASGVSQASEFRANTYVDEDQRSPAVSSDANGNFVVVWQSYFQDKPSYSYGVFGQRFSAGGVPLSPEFQVNAYTTSSQLDPAVASAANGNFVVVWASLGQDGSGFGVFGQRYGDLIFKNGFE